MKRQVSLKWVVLAVILFALLVGIFFVVSGKPLLPARTLYRAAQNTEPGRASLLYRCLARQSPQIAEYAHLWAAEAAMPDLDAWQTLQSVAAFRPHSPAAYQAHIAIARYYASIDEPRAADSYRAALALNDDLALRLELAQFLEEQGDNGGAYAEYLDILGQQPDAFSGMRRTGEAPLAVAGDLIAATYYSDALETLRWVDDTEAGLLRAQALGGLGQYEAAEEAYQAWLEANPEDVTAQLGLGRALADQGRSDEALSVYQDVDTPDSQMARAGLLEEDDVELALELYRESPYPVAWWAATALLEDQGRLTDTLPLYARLGQTDSYLADDAAYRLLVLAGRVEDEAIQADAAKLLENLDLNWLGLRAAGDQLILETAPALDETGIDIVDKARALDAIGREDLAELELEMAARFRPASQTALTAAGELSARGQVMEAQSIAETYLDGQSRAPKSIWQLSYPTPYSTTVEAAAAEFDVDPLLIWAMMREESRYDPAAVSYVGARGLMQVMPATQAWIAGELEDDIPPGEAFVPETNIRMAAWFVRFLLDYFDGDDELAIAAYNGGATSVDNWLADSLVSDRDDLLRWIGFGETREYLQRVSLSYRVYQVLYAED